MIQISKNTFTSEHLNIKYDIDIKGCRIEYMIVCFRFIYISSMQCHHKHTLNNVNKYPSITCSYIQEYLGYRSNNLYELFTHSRPVLVYKSGHVQRNSQVERKTNIIK